MTEYETLIGVTYYFGASVPGKDEKEARENAEALADAIAERVTPTVSIHDDGDPDLFGIGDYEAGTDEVSVHSVLPSDRPLCRNCEHYNSSDDTMICTGAKSKYYKYHVDKYDSCDHHEPRKV